MTIRYFADTARQTIEFSKVDHRGGAAGTWGWDANSNQWVRVNRKVNYKAFASKHICDARCINATGRTMNCECSCGGKNHGRGHFVAEAA